jgi:ABC-type Fe3+ transport system permease subunit
MLKFKLKTLRKQKQTQVENYIKREKKRKQKLLLLLIFRRWLVLIILVVVPLLIVGLDIPSNELIRRY